MKLHCLLILLGVFLFALQFSACSHPPVAPSNPHYGFRPVKAEFNVGDGSRFKFEVFSMRTDEQSRLLIHYGKYDLADGKKLGAFFRISTDGGANLGPERTLPKLPSRRDAFPWANFFFIKGGLAAVCEMDGNLFYTRSDADGASWSEPVQINDEQGPVAIYFSIIERSEDEVYCLWQDRRRGFFLTFFSASHDGGRTWSPNKPVEYDFREGEQTRPQLVEGAGGRLLAFWTDSRDRQTLKDIRCSYSDDGGRHWSPSRKINDDSEHVWQENPAVVARGDKIYVAFEDFREPGDVGDNDWNIYFTASEDNGESWSKNIRLNDVQEGTDNYPELKIDERGNLYCVWRSSRETIFGHPYFTYSRDGGKSWSRAIKVGDGDGLVVRRPAGAPQLFGEKLLCLWLERHPGEDKTFPTWLEPLVGPAPAEAPAPEPEQPAPISYSEGEQLFADDFSDGSAARWQAGTGVWMVTDGAYMGVEPGTKQVHFSSFARLKEPEGYILRGRFKLDPVEHFMANLYFRADPGSGKYYVISHLFRVGACLSLREGDLSRAGLGFEGRALAERRFSFQNNRWYDFTLVVTPEQIDHYVDGRLMLSYKGQLKLPPGIIGIGGDSSAPTYFDDIAVYEIAR